MCARRWPPTAAGGLTVARALALLGVATCLVVGRPAPAREPAAKPATCAQLRRQVEAELAAAQRCKAGDECVAITFAYAFAPCGASARRGASLDKADADARRFQDRCHPVLHP
jgi:hypothetical protein